MPEISVCICTHGRPRYLAACLAGLARQTVAPGRFEVVVVDSASPAAAAAEIARLTEATPGARLVRLDRPGLSVARNAGALAARAGYVAYIDDDAVPAPDWIERIAAAVTRAPSSPAVLAGRILPRWEAELPGWWPKRLRGVLSIIEFEGAGAFRSAAVPATLEPYGANMVVRRDALLAAGGFNQATGRVGKTLLSDEDVQLAWTLQDRGEPVLYDGGIVVTHSIQASRLNPRWLLTRLYWQGTSTVATRRLLGEHRFVARALLRRLAVVLLLLPAALVPLDSAWLIGPRWRLAYSWGFVRAALQRPRRPPPGPITGRAF
jgi:glycosyltransferase involved in cell wall biosynthesis